MSQYPTTPSSSYAPPDSAYSIDSRKSTAIDGLEGDGDSIRVVVRVRPLNGLEKQRSDGQVVSCANDLQTLKIDGVINGKPIPSMTFHRVFDEVTAQEQLFETCGVKNLVEHAVEGYNTTIFAYGQTGSGKSHSITGPDDVILSNNDSDRWGIVPRSLRYIFDLVNQQQRTDGTKFIIHASFLEIYNEQVQDLLNTSSSSLPVRFSTEKGFYVENLFVVECEVLDDCLAVLEEGLRNRRIGSHRLNEHSSRSHSLMTVYVESETIDPDDQRSIRKKGKITFVDLAGSERVKESRATGETLTETLNINKSLLTLGNCISALSEMKKKKGNNNVTHIPYRDSKLTKLLSDTLGGSGMTLMLACVSPSGFNLHETINTLRYASRAKRIQNRPVVQMDPREELIMQLKKELKATKSENESLRQMVMELSGGRPINESTLSKISASRASSVGGVRLPLIANPTSSTTPTPIITSPAPVEAPKETPELVHTKQMLTRFMEENTKLKSTNNELVANGNKISRENRELMEENDRLIGKIEKLVEIFGNSLDQEASVATAASGAQPTSLNVGNARLYLLSRRAIRKSDAGKVEETATTTTISSPGQQSKKTIHVGVDFTKNRSIDRSIADISLASKDAGTPDGGIPKEVGPTKNYVAVPAAADKIPANVKSPKNTRFLFPTRRNSENEKSQPINNALDEIQKNKDQLKRELEELDEEIKSLQKT